MPFRPLRGLDGHVAGRYRDDGSMIVALSLTALGLG
jgi:hypothetical protein